MRIDEHGLKSFLKLAMFVMDAQGNFYASNFQQVGVRQLLPRRIMEQLHIDWFPKQ